MSIFTRVLSGAAEFAPSPISAVSSKSVSTVTVIFVKTNPSRTAIIFTPMPTQPTIAARAKKPGGGPEASPPIAGPRSVVAAKRPCSTWQASPSPMWPVVA